MNSYPDAFPVASAQLIIVNLRNGSVYEDRIAFAHAVWVLAGYALKVSLGDAQPVGFTAAPDISDDEVVAILESATASQEGVMLGMPIPWKTILKWALKALAAAL